MVSRPGVLPRRRWSRSSSRPPLRRVLSPATEAYLLLDRQRIANAGPLPERNLSAACFGRGQSLAQGGRWSIVHALLD